MNINKHNYEAFFLDYHEGTLTPQQVADLLLFVEQHPELKEEFESFENLTLEDLDSVSFEGKSSLKKDLSPTLSKGEGKLPPINVLNKEEYFIRSVENTLAPAEKQLLETFIKQHPQFLIDFELFQKTKVSADTNIVFENKEALKKTVVTSDDLLIASVEGLLTKQETIFLNQQLSVDAEMQHTYSLYKQTKAKADLSVVYQDKEELKRDLSPALSKGEGVAEENDKRKIIPFFYYVAAAASIALLIGLFFFYKNGKETESTFADKTNGAKSAPVENNVNNNEVVKNIPEIVKEVSVPNQTASLIKNKVNPPAPKKNPVILNEQPENNIAENKKENSPREEPKKEVIVKVEEPKINKEEQPAIAKIDNTQPSVKKQPLASPSDFLSLKEVVAEKIKEKTLDDASLAMQKKSGRSKRMTGWDMVQIVTKGISKVTGRDVEVKPTYNDEGDVTAYALGNGLQFSRGK